MFSGPLGRLFAGRDNPLKQGDIFDLTGLRIEIKKMTSDGDPGEVLYTFSVPLRDPSLRWIKWEHNGYVSIHPPDPGQVLKLAPPCNPFEMISHR